MGTVFQTMLPLGENMAKDCTNRKLNIARATQVEYCVIFAIAHVGRFERGRTKFLSSISQVYDAR